MCVCTSGWGVVTEEMHSVQYIDIVTKLISNGEMGKETKCPRHQRSDAPTVIRTSGGVHIYTFETIGMDGHWPATISRPNKYDRPYVFYLGEGWGVHIYNSNAFKTKCTTIYFYFDNFMLFHSFASHRWETNEFHNQRFVSLFSSHFGTLEKSDQTSNSFHIKIANFVSQSGIICQSKQFNREVILTPVPISNVSTLKQKPHFQFRTHNNERYFVVLQFGCWVSISDSITHTFNSYSLLHSLIFVLSLARSAASVYTFTCFIVENLNIFRWLLKRSSCLNYFSRVSSAVR